MLAPVAHGDERLWLEYEIKVKRTRKEFYERYEKVITEREEVEGIKIWGVIPEEELARIILRHVQYLFEKGYDQEEIINRITENFGLRRESTKEFFDYAG
ncbi:hypothetical protein DRP05_10180 [Archaeoglobales archaeon]|nr:MAG: hypothetical protein DRP05_10180 [Archaeoglobales archaeon]